jgi:hypothetical protein
MKQLKGMLGRFIQGMVPWNKGKKGIHLSPETEFKKGQFVGETHPSWQGGVQKMKSDCAYIWDGANERVRRPKLIWEEHFGKLPKGYLIYHKDGDNKNDSIENLEAITRAELLKRNRAKNGR